MPGSMAADDKVKVTDWAAQTLAAHRKRMWIEADFTRASHRRFSSSYSQTGRSENVSRLREKQDTQQRAFSNSMLHAVSKRGQFLVSLKCHSCAVKCDTKQILTIVCPTCGKRPGEYCALSTGRPRNTPHRDRRLAAEDIRAGSPSSIVPNLQRVCFVSFRHRGANYSNTTTALSFFDAAAKALEFFCGPSWKGPRPGRNTVLAVTLFGDPSR